MLSSLSVWGAWIETLLDNEKLGDIEVALRMGSVD